MHKIPPEVDFEFSQVSRKVRILEWTTIDNAEQCFPHDKIVDSHSCDEKQDIKRAKRLTQALTSQRMSSPPIRAKYKHFETICEHTFDNSPTVSKSSFLKLWSS